MRRGKVIKQAILIAEDLFPERKSGKKKRKFCVDFINSHLDIPWVSEKKEEVLIGWFVDLFCEELFDKLKKAK